MRNWLSTIALVATGLGVANQANAAGIPVWDPARFGTQTGDYSSNLTVVGATTVDGEAGLELQLNQQWAQIGQRFTTPRNWSTYNGLGFVLQNKGAEAAEFGLRFDRDTAGTDRVVTVFRVEPNSTLRVVLDRTGWNLTPQPQKGPLPLMDQFYRHNFSFQSAALNPVHSWQFYYRGTSPLRVAIGPLTMFNIEHNGTNLVDTFGQLTSRDWPTKAATNQDLVNARNDELADLAANPGTGETFGSSTFPVGTAGRWRVVRSNGRAYFMTPAGRFFWSLGATTVQTNYATRVGGRTQMFGGLPQAGSPLNQFFGTTRVGNSDVQTFNHYGANLYRKYGETWANDWGVRTRQRLTSWGFNTLGSGTDVNHIGNLNMPYTVTKKTDDFPIRLTPPNYYWRDFPDPFAASFLQWMTDNWRGDIQWFSRDQRFMGVYVDGEHTWGIRGGTPRELYQLPLAAMLRDITQPAKVEWVRQVRRTYGDTNLAGFNAVYGTNFTDWAQVTATPISLTDAQLDNALVKRDLSAFLQNFAHVFSLKARTALKNLGCTALFLGTRDILLHTPDEVLRGISRNVDVLSVTHYSRVNDVPWAIFAAQTKPVLIAEFSFMGRDQNAPATCFTEGAETRNQAERATATRAYLDAALAARNVIGIHWFTYVDQPLTGHAAHGENAQFGLVDVTDRPYQSLVNVFRDFSRGMYTRRGR